MKNKIIINIHICPLCLSNQTRLIIKNEYTMSFCVVCRVYYILSYKKSEDKLLFPLDKDDRAYSSLTRLILRFFYNLRVKKILHNIPKSTFQTMNIIDFGGGKGDFARILAKQAKYVIVVEPESDYITYYHGIHNLKLINKKITPLLLKNNILQPHFFDIVTMWHVLEHLENPREAFTIVNKVLKNYGLFFISVPNAESLQWKLSKKYWAYLDPMHHKFQYTYRGLKDLLEQNGFTVTHRFLFSWEYDFFGWHQTILNIVSRSYNLLYNDQKKRMQIRRKDKNIYKFWISFINSIHFLFFPTTIFLTILSRLVWSPSCIEIMAYKRKK